MYNPEAELLKLQIDELKEKILIVYNSTARPDENVVRLTGELHMLLIKYKYLRDDSTNPAA